MANFEVMKLTYKNCVKYQIYKNGSAIGDLYDTLEEANNERLRLEEAGKRKLAEKNDNNNIHSSR